MTGWHGQTPNFDRADSRRRVGYFTREIDFAITLPQRPNIQILASVKIIIADLLLGTGRAG